MIAIKKSLLIAVTDDDPKFETALTLADLASLFVKPNIIDGLNVF
tara:strand:+ start:1225 stop:1359 length:135 start_codon:yes stop_codon:yes gene_type:complete